MEGIGVYRAAVTIGGSAAAAALLAPAYAGLPHEELRIVHLDARLRLLHLAPGICGDPASVDLPVRSVVADALRLGSRALILAHNHPAGNPHPSGADCRATRLLVEVARALEIRVVDHLIFAPARWVSFRAMGLL